MEGEPLLLVEHEVSSSSDALLAAIPVGDFRSDGQGAVFRIRLLVEIAARALSPATNDFYTAIACADRLAYALLHHRESWVDEAAMPCAIDDPAIELPGEDLRGLFEDPLNAFRQSACRYPSVSIPMIDNYARVAAAISAENRSGELAAFLRAMAHELAEHAAGSAQFDRDKQGIRAAFAKGFAA